LKNFYKESLVDRSDSNRYCFSLTCLECGMVRTYTVEIKKAGIRNRESAREQAAEEAMREFQICPICGHIVCSRCFFACGDLKMCRFCTNDMKRHEESL